MVAGAEAGSRDERSNEQTRRRINGVTVATRRQTLEEQRQFDAALDLLLTEIVRQEIAKAKGIL